MTVPVQVVTGFLGAGKTTLLNRLLSDGAFANTAVIVNEFGDVGIDHLLVEKSNADDTMIELSDGCLCCTVRSDLAETLIALGDRIDAGAMLDRIIIETTGLADPAPVLQTVMATPGVRERFHAAGVVTVVCSLTGLDSIDGHEEARRQVALADTVVITKTDMAPMPRGLSERLKLLNPLAEILDAHSPDFRLPLDDAGLAPSAGRAVDDAGHDGHAHRHGTGIEAFTLRHDAPVPIDRIGMFIDLLRATTPQTLLRMKGIVWTAEKPDRPAVLHGVQSVFSAPVWLDGWKDIPRETRLVVIAKNGDRKRIAGLFAAFTGQVAVDTPDRDAISANPLAIPGT